MRLFVGNTPKSGVRGSKMRVSAFVLRSYRDLRRLGLLQKKPGKTGSRGLGLEGLGKIGKEKQAESAHRDAGNC